MHVTMVKKRLANGQPCEKCVQAEELLKRRGLWSASTRRFGRTRTTRSAGMVLAEAKGVTLAPFFVVKDGAAEQVYTSALGFIKERLSDAAATPVVPSGAALDSAGAEALGLELAGIAPGDVMKRILSQYGARAAISFSGAEDVMLDRLGGQIRPSVLGVLTRYGAPPR